MDYNLAEIDVPANFFTKCMDNGYDDIAYFISEYAYRYTHKLEKVTLNSSKLTEFDFEMIKLSYKTISHLDLGATTNTSLQAEAFHNWFNLQSLVLPAGLEHIDYMAVAECIRLEEITIPASVTEINARAFENCRSLTKATFAGKALKSIGDWSFYNCHELQTIDLPEGVENIGKAAFYGCAYLQNAVVPASVQAIGDNAFALCSKMQQMEVRAVVPPTIEAKTFEQVSREMPVFVPAISVAAYKADQYWGRMNIVGQETAVENTTHDANVSRKQLVNGQLLILLGGKTYNVQGLEVK